MKASLEALRRRYETEPALALDPIAVPLRFPDPMDRELTAFVAAHLAYGKVAPMLRAIEGLLKPLGERPAEFLRSQAEPALRAELEAALQGWVWRFHTGSDLVQWLLAWKRLDQASGAGLEAHLLPAPAETADGALSRLVQRLRVELPPTYGLRFNLPDPLEGASCKRWRMFLRWMVREGWPDFGLWKRYPKDQLVIPVDTHVARIARYVGLTQRNTVDGRMAAEITAALKKRDRQDPLKYDFAISHLGILGDCPGVRALPGCRRCPLVGICRAGKG
ncbi:MAG: TIGR02757 family protein [Holophagaceae bacterium]|nr:TIGR02757 family protein [Holophagaceae bacterium]